MAQIPSNFQFATRGATTLFLWVAVLMTSSETLGQGTDPVWRVVQGQWEVTSLTGSIKLEWLDTNPPWCERGGRTFNTVLDKEKTFVRFFKIINDDYNSKLDSIPIHKKETEEEFGTFHLPINPKKPFHSFVFQFGFDNGSHSNSLSEGQVHEREANTIVRGLWSDACGVVGVPLSDSGTDKIIVFALFHSGTKWGGHGEFKVEGTLTSENRITGTWKWTENTAGPFPQMECRTTSKGSGTWVAVKK